MAKNTRMICNSWNGGEFFDDFGLYLIIMFCHGNLNFPESASTGQAMGWSAVEENDGWVYVIIKKD